MLKHKKVFLCCAVVLVATLGMVFYANSVDNEKEKNIYRQAGITIIEILKRFHKLVI